MLRILLGYRTDSLQKEAPAVLYCGHYASELETAAANAPEEFIALHRAEVPVTRRARRDPALVGQGASQKREPFEMMLDLLEVPAEDREDREALALEMATALQGQGSALVGLRDEVLRLHAQEKELTAELSKIRDQQRGLTTELLNTQALADKRQEKIDEMEKLMKASAVSPMPPPPADKPEAAPAPPEATKAEPAATKAEPAAKGKHAGK